MFLVEKKSFFVGCAFSSLLIGLLSVCINFILPFALLIVVISCAVVFIIKNQWTNRISKEVFVVSLDKKISKLKAGVDKNSNIVLDYLRSCIYDSLFFTGANIGNAYTKLPDFQYKYRKQWIEERFALSARFREIGIEKACPEVAFFRHGLISCDSAILDYIKTRDIFDLGAYVGDSALILSEYTDRTVFSFELSNKNAEQFRQNIGRSGIKNVVLIESGVSDHCEDVKINDTGQSNTGICGRGTETVKLTTVDDEAMRLHANVGFIKADLEGFGLKMIRGAINTIKQHRPVISIGIYHNYEELFEIKPFLEEHVTNYEFKFQLHSFSEGKFVDLSLFCYPQEVLANGTNGL